MTDTLGENVTVYNYRLELQQEGHIIFGKSRVEMLEDPNTYVEYSVSAQYFPSASPPYLAVTENRLGDNNHYMDFPAANDVVVAKLVHLKPGGQPGSWTLNGIWVALVHSLTNDPDGEVQLSLQP